LKNYEGLFLIKPEFEAEELKTLYQSIQDIVKKHKGEIENAEEWGKKPLSFKIGKNKEALYYLLKFKIDPDQVKGLNTELTLNESIIRVMLTKA